MYALIYERTYNFAIYIFVLSIFSMTKFNHPSRNITVDLSERPPQLMDQNCSSKILNAECFSARRLHAKRFCLQVNSIKSFQ